MKPALYALYLFFILSHSAYASYTLIYTGNLNGELEPCGCTLEGDFGGIKRHATMIDRLRKKDPALMFVSSGGLLIAEMPSDKIRSDYILRGITLLDYDLIGIQARDLAFGTEFISRYNLPFILSNAAYASQFSYSKTLQRHSQSFSFFQYAELASPTSMQQTDSAKTIVLKQLRENLAQGKKSGHITIVTTTLRLSVAKKILPLNKIDLLIIPSRQDNFIEPVQMDNTLLLQPGARGMRFGQLQFELKKSAKGNTLVHWQHTVIPLPQTIPDAPRTASWYTAYNAELKIDYEKQVGLRNQREQGKSPYAGAEACQGCHQPEYKIWQTSQHARAYDKLENVDKVFDPNCIDCHSVGFNQPGGFLNAELTPQLINVQCESCHGAAQAHIEQAGKKETINKGRNIKKICEQCHVGSHSPSFDINNYWPKVAHGKTRK